MTTFLHRQIALSFILGRGQFGESDTDTVRLSGPLRASVEFQASGVANQCHIAVHGLTLSKMNQLSTLGIRATEVRRNSVIVEAGDTTNGLSTVFSGQIIDAFFDGSGMPDISFIVSAMGGYLQQIRPMAPTSYPGLASVALILEGIAKQAGLGFVNSGVTASLYDPYLPGTAVDQIRSCAQASNTQFIIEADTLYIWPKGGSRGDITHTISPQTGMIGYPSFSQSGVVLNTLYSPDIRYGQKIQVHSELTGANGLWQIQTLSHTLESETPNGQWQSRMAAVPPGLFAQGGVVVR